MLEKHSGKVAYAVMSFGGFLGLGHDHYPVPWGRLTYNENLGGYEVNISDKELKGAPKFGETEWSWGSGARAQSIILQGAALLDLEPTALRCSCG